MNSYTSNRHAFQDYDHVVLMASWGIPEEWRKVEYCVEVEVAENDYKRRTENIKGEYYASIAALKCFIDNLRSNSSAPRTELLIFVPDTILLNEAVRGNYKSSWNEVKRREELYEKLYRALYRSKTGVAKELGVNDWREYQRFVKFVPGVLSARDDSKIYTWRGKEAYDVITGVVALHTYDKLNSLADAKRVMIIADTSHGINYLVTSFIEGIGIGATLYAFNRVIEEKELEELAICQYNSDPILKSTGIPSLKLHLLSKTYVVRDSKISLSRLSSIVEDSLRMTGLKNLVKRMNKLWELKTNSEKTWEEGLCSLQLFLRGVLIWALKISSKVKDKLPSKEELYSSLDRIQVEFKREGARGRVSCNVTYKWGENRPHILVITMSMLVKMLDKLAEKISICDEKIGETICDLKRRISSTPITHTEYLELVQDALSTVSTGDWLCLSIGNLISYVEKIYPEPYLSINVNELEKFKKYVIGKEDPTWEKIIDLQELQVFKEPHSRALFMKTSHGKTRVIVPRKETVGKRPFYAHAGLAYGLEHFCINLSEDKACICLGDTGDVIQLLKRKERNRVKD